MTRITPGIVLAAVLSASAAQAATCQPVKFATGTSSATIHGIAPANTTGAEGICYTLAVRPGQTVDIALTGENVGMTVLDVGDMRDHFHFVTKSSSYTFRVGQVVLAPMNKPPFSFTVSVK